MKQSDQIFALLDMIDRPAFCVKDDRILRCNQAAQRFLLPDDATLRSLIVNGLQEYGTYSSGNLYLSLNLAGTVRSACVTRMSGIDLVAVEPENTDADLQSLALAAQTLRQPLATMSLAAEALSTSHDPESRAHLSRLNKSIYQLLRLTDNMTDAYAYTLDSTPAMAQRDVAAMLREIFGSIGNRLSQAGIHLEFDCSVDSVFSLADQTMLERAVGNLISNAVKYAPNGGSIRAALSRKDNMLYLTVADNGDGILGSAGGNLFNQFRRGPSIEDGQKGLGLGLHLIRCAASAHRGTVLIQNDDNGSRITMTLAIRQGENPVLRERHNSWNDPVLYDRNLIELADVLPVSAFQAENLL